MPDGVLINGKGPYRYNNTLVPDGIEYETIDVHPGEYFKDIVCEKSCKISILTKWIDRALSICNMEYVDFCLSSASFKLKFGATHTI